jgi:hypothetical protein
MEEQGVSKLVSVKFTDTSGNFSKAKAPPRNEISTEETPAGDLETAGA